VVEACSYTSIQHNEIVVFMVNVNYLVYWYLPMNVIVKGQVAITCKILNLLLTAYGRLKRVTDKFLQQPYTHCPSRILQQAWALHLLQVISTQKLLMHDPANRKNSHTALQLQSSECWSLDVCQDTP